MSTTHQPQRLLHVDSSILAGQSVSRQLSAAVVAQLRKDAPGLQVTYRDLVSAPIPHLSGAHLAGDPSLQADLELGRAVLDEFLAADVVVVGLGFYNFGVPSQLKAWVDRLAIAGKTFRYSEKGPEGLAGGKRVILAISRGGFYGPGAPAASLEHAESYLRGVFAFFGIPEVEVVAAEGVNTGPQGRQAGIEKAQSQIAALAAA